MLDKIRGLVPKPLIDAYRKARRQREHARNRQRSTEEVFTEVYEKGLWNADGKHGGTYVSGGGTRDQRIADAYIETISRLSDELGFRGATFVDLGCGDMAIGSRLIPLAGRYIGVDIVRPLVEELNRTRGSETVSFECRNIIEDDLPAGKICFLRQVLQHLSNDQIAAILPKLAAFERVFISEHLPTPRPGIVPNKDKAHGGGIRVYEASGVFVGEPPFSLPSDRLQVVLEVPSHELTGYDDSGIIQTILYTPGG